VDAAPTGYPEGQRERDRFVLDLRPSRPRHDPWRHQGVLLEEEPDARGRIAPAATVFLTGRECPWRCVMCDLWRYTTVEETPRGAIPAQLDQALAEGADTASVVKLYNAGSFFDAKAVPLADYDAIAVRLARFGHVIVESHPALVGPAVDRLQEALSTHGAPGLEVAMGLETAHPEALERLHKRMSLDQFARAAEALAARDVGLRAFLLVHPPFVPCEERLEWLERSLDFAFSCGATAVSLIPTRTGNGALEALERLGLFEPPSLGDLEQAAALALARAGGRVFADLWDIGRLAVCRDCFPARSERLRLQNLQQRPQAAVACTTCGDE